MSQPIPRPAGVPILGNIFDVNPSNPWDSIKTLAEKYGDIFQIKVLGKTIVFVASVELAEEICDEKRFRKFVGGPIVEIRAAVNDSLFTAFHNEESWGVAHRIIAPYLQPDALAEQFVPMRDAAIDLMEIWKSSTGPVVPWRDLARLDLETVTLTLFGKRLNCLMGPEHPMIQYMEDSTSEAVKRPTRPGFLNWLLYGSKFKSSNRRMREFAESLVSYRHDNPTDKKDLLWALLNAEDPQTGKALTRSQVIDEIVTMPIGSSTAPCLLATAILFLQQNPTTIKKARKELEAVIGQGEFKREHLAQLRYVDAIVRETLRLSFAAPGFNIEPMPSQDKTPVVLGGGRYQVAHDQAMILVLAGVNRDPAVFDDPLAFKPERWMGDEMRPGARKWFGNGKRICIGMHYAWQWSSTVLAMMLREVDFELVDADYELKQDGWFNVRPIGLEVRVKARS
ncbi:hypothetical protein XA68_15663 [Ophiocordyceps unilateralis]|uniref:Cytochrome P450 n=1 Tax=Ophiocordyceps unilateralis TaxID=268505 RepID=A0A2A9P7T4_OPHUN|nr:hypothetical protein XA68_15663 [Ophiocordyceps unilateralis]